MTMRWNWCWTRDADEMVSKFGVTVVHPKTAEGHSRRYGLSDREGGQDSKSDAVFSDGQVVGNDAKSSGVKLSRANNSESRVVVE